MSKGKMALGRGLADLLPVGGDGISGNPALGTGQEVPIALVHPNPRQPRTHFDDAALDELANSIRQNGILQPLLVRPRPAGGYEIVAGERRYRAALKAGERNVPIVVRQLSDAETLALALIENLIREDIGPLETARAFQRLMSDFGWTQEEMGSRVGKSRSAVANALRLLKLPDVIQLGIEKGDLTEGHARALLGDDRENQTPAFRERQMRVFRQTVERRLSVREVERLMSAGRGTQAAGQAPPSDGDPAAPPPSVAARSNRTAAPDEFAALEDRLRTALGTRVRLTGSATRGQIEIGFYSAEELDGLLTRLGAGFEPL